MKLTGDIKFFVAVIAVISLTVAVCVFAFSFSGAQIDYIASYYIVCRYVKTDAIAAGALSSSVSDLGGAGYVLEYDGDYYVTVACYYNRENAESVCANLKERNINCTVINAERHNFSVENRTRGKQYAGNLNTLHSLSKLAYDCANGLDDGSINQTAAAAVLADIKSGLNGLKKANPDNCFSGEIKRLISECDEADDGIIYSKNLRRLQIAVIDCILNIDLL